MRRKSLWTNANCALPVAATPRLTRQEGPQPAAHPPPSWLDTMRLKGYFETAITLLGRFALLLTGTCTSRTRRPRRSAAAAPATDSRSARSSASNVLTGPAGRANCTSKATPPGASSSRRAVVGQHARRACSCGLVEAAGNQEVGGALMSVTQISSSTTTRSLSMCFATGGRRRRRRLIREAGLTTSGRARQRKPSPRRAPRRFGQAIPGTCLLG